MAQKVNVSMPQDLDLPANWTIRVTALDTAGALVTGIKVSDISILADAPLGVDTSLAVGDWFLVLGPGA